MAFNLKNIVCILSLFVIFANPTWGDFLQEFLEAFDPPVDGIVVDQTNKQIDANEGLPENLTIAKILVTGSDPVIITDSQTTAVKLVQSETEGEWHLVLVEVLDTDPPFREQLYLVPLAHSGQERFFQLQTKDINDSPVQIENDPGRLLENPYDEITVPDTSKNISWVDASDVDVIDIGQLRYDFEHVIGGPNDTFSINEAGQVFQMKPFDYRVASMHRLRIIVFDSGDIHQASATLTIDVKDIPDLAPEFIQLPVGLNVNERTELGNIIATIVAHDGDLGLNWGIEYTLTESHSPEFPFKYFGIDQNGGIYVNEEIDAEFLFSQENSFVFNITVIAKEIPPADEFPGFEALETSATILVTIGDINDNPPQVCTVENPDSTEDNENCGSSKDFSVEIFEDFSGTLVLNLPLVVRDLDSTYANSQYDIAFGPGTPDIITRAFRVQPSSSVGTTGVSILATPAASALLDYEGTEGSFWYDSDHPEFLPVPREFDIIITEKSTGPANLSTANARITLTVKDVNDFDPVFQGTINNEYLFNVCENTPDDTPLTVKEKFNETFPTCKDAIEPEPAQLIKVVAIDEDISPKFRNIQYQWKSRDPPVQVDPSEGTMIIRIGNDGRNFDYERFAEELYIIQATDSIAEDCDCVPRMAQVTIVFSILDVSDQFVTLDLGSASQIYVQEGINDPGLSILSGISASDVDVDPDIHIWIDWEQTKLFRTDSNGVPNQLHVQNLFEINDWFDIQFADPDPSIANKKVVNLVLTETVIDREFKPEGVDRVDLVFAAEDRNDPEPGRVIKQTLTIRINDTNDNFPTFEDIEEGVVEVQLQIQETREDEVDDSPVQREISSFRASDLDLATVFSFWLEARGCVSDCDEYLDLVELLDFSTTGRAILYRRSGKMIDREETKFFGVPTDFLNYTLWVSDQVHNTSISISINVNDINDNIPQWKEIYDDKVYSVKELAEMGDVIETFQATDEDSKNKYGKISYKYDRNIGPDVFSIDEETGVLSVKGDREFDWSVTKIYNLTIAAIDNYRSESAIDSLQNITTITITIIDENTKPPDFVTDSSIELGRIYETFPKVDVPLEQTIEVKDDDDPDLDNGKFNVNIVKVLKDGVEQTPLPFKTGPLENSNPAPVKKVPIIPTQSFIGEWGTYVITFSAQDLGLPALGPSTKDYTLTILNENLNAPVFIYPKPDSTTREIISIKSEEGPLLMWNETQIPAIEASDADDPSTGNGQVGYQTVEHLEDPADGFQYFSVNMITKRLYLLKPFGDENVQYYNLYLKAEDNGEEPKNSTTMMQFFLVSDSNRPPQFNDSTPVNITIPENEVGFSYPIMPAFDPDYEFEDVPGLPPIETAIYYHIVGGSEGSLEYFKIEIKDLSVNGTEMKVPHIVTIEPLDREFIKDHELVVLASNSESESEVTNPDQIPPGNPSSYLLVRIEVENLFDTFPEFPPVEEGGIISGGFSDRNYQDEVISLISVIDRDDFDFVTFSLSSTFTPSDASLSQISTPFIISQNSNRSADLALTFTPQPDMKGHFTFNITATDLGSLSTTVQCKMYMIKEDNVVQFKFVDRRDLVMPKLEMLAIALSNAFSYRCNIDRTTTDESSADDITIVYTHFIDLINNEPVLAVYIEGQQFNSDTWTRLNEGLRDVGLTLARDGIGKPQETTKDEKQLVIYILVGGIGFMGVVLIVLGTSCYFNNRRLALVNRSLTALQFGSQQSGLNRTGAALDLPNTNEFAIEGSNPMWTTDHSDKKIPAFDAESVGSGGSVLIGVEDDEDFKGYKSAPFEPYEDDEDMMYDNNENPGGNRNALYQSDSPGEDDHEASNPRRNYDSYDDGDNNQEEMPPPFDTGVKRNPLMTMFDQDA